MRDGSALVIVATEHSAQVAATWGGRFAKVGENAPDIPHIERRPKACALANRENGGAPARRRRFSRPLSSRAGLDEGEPDRRESGWSAPRHAACSGFRLVEASCQRV
jgi:hypothetical protein